MSLRILVVEFIRMKKLFSILFTLFLFVACQKPEPCCPVDPPVDPPQDSTQQWQQYGIPFGGVAQPEDAALYEVNPLVFSTSRNLQGILPRLDSIKALGVNVVWLMPIYEMGVDRSVGSPYCISDYFKVNPEYGTIDDLRELVDSAHAKGMAVMLDWVANHTSWDHSWMSDQSYYVVENGSVIHPPGTNWEDVAELNYANAEMRAEMISAMKYWILEANIDGYRCDYATGVPAWFWEEAIDSLRAIPGRELLLFAESNDLSLLNEGFDMAFSWNFYGALLDAFNGGDARNLRTTHLGEFSTLASGKTMVRFVTNHDQHAWDDVPQDLLGGQNGAIAAFAAAAYMGGVPLIYNGQEKGLPYQLPFFIPTSVAINWSLNPTISKKYEKIMQVYAQEPALKGPELLDNYSTYSISAFTKANSSDTLLIAINTNGSAKSFTFPVEWQGKQLTDLITGQTAVSSTAISLNGFQYCVWKK